MGNQFQRISPAYYNSKISGVKPPQGLQSLFKTTQIGTVLIGADGNIGEIEELEHTTGTRVGSIHLSAKEPLTEKRRTKIEILHADSESLMGLLKYKQILCEHEPFAEDDPCKTEQTFCSAPPLSTFFPKYAEYY